MRNVRKDGSFMVTAPAHPRRRAAMQLAPFFNLFNPGENHVHIHH